jgi:hypothetical protein
MAKKTKTPTSRALRLFWKPMGSVHESHARSFRSWLEKNADGIDIATFIHSSSYAKKHAKALSDLIE